MELYTKVKFMWIRAWEIYVKPTPAISSEEEIVD